jgi:ribosomal protein S18 acetylase RimI-like enzyme
MTTFTITPYTDAHSRWAYTFMKTEWGSPLMVTRGILYDVLKFLGFVALVDGQPQGIVTYNIHDTSCEILILHSTLEGYGIGAALVENVKQVAHDAGCKRLWLITTNDNIHAIRWYQKRGFTLAAVHVNALEQSRKLKPQIPLIGTDGIPLRDEIEFEMILGK